MTSSRAPDAKAGEGRFRSWGEIQIARMLDHHGLSFQYEQPVAVVEQGRTRLWYPDFQLCGQGILLEYCGRPHDPAYSEGVARKRAVYAANGLTALMFTPDVFQGRWPTAMLDEVESVLVTRLESFRAARRRSLRGADDILRCCENTRRRRE